MLCQSHRALLQGLGKDKSHFPILEAGMLQGKQNVVPKSTEGFQCPG